jgi:hypothetical protein
MIEYRIDEKLSRRKFFLAEKNKKFLPINPLYRKKLLPLSQLQNVSLFTGRNCFSSPNLLLNLKIERNSTLTSRQLVNKPQKQAKFDPYRLSGGRFTLKLIKFDPYESQKDAELQNRTKFDSW